MKLMIKYSLILFGIFGLVKPEFAQVSVSVAKIDFGTITRQSDRVIDFTFANNGESNTSILRSGFSPEYDILYSSRSIDPGSSETLRIKFNPRQKGAFYEEISIWFSSMKKPIVLTFKGEVEYVDDSGNIGCPDFRSRPANSQSEESFVVEIVDKESQYPIRKGRVRIVEKGRLRTTLTTDRNGQSDFNVPISYYYLVADAEGYMPADTASYINRRNNYFRFELDRLPENKEVELITHQVEEVEKKEMEIVEEVSIRIEFAKAEEPEEESKTNTAVTMEPPEATGLGAALPVERYKRNNIVFLIDVSQSMSQKGRMDLLKAAMLELVEVIRDVDEVAIVTYASHPEVVLKRTTGDRKQDISQIVENLEAGGMTAGAKGFKSAYSQLMRGFLDDGNNQLIVVTDGAFKVSDTGKIENLVEKYQKKGVKTSVLGIKSNIHATRGLSSIAESGKGSFIKIENYDHSKHTLINEIKKQSAIVGIND